METYNLDHFLVWKKFESLIYRHLSSKKAVSLGIIPMKVLKDSSDICNSILQDIWKTGY